MINLLEKFSIEIMKNKEKEFLIIIDKFLNQYLLDFNTKEKINLLKC